MWPCLERVDPDAEEVEEEPGVVRDQQVLEGLAQVQQLAGRGADGVELAPHAGEERAGQEVHLIAPQAGSTPSAPTATRGGGKRGEAGGGGQHDAGLSRR